jgi:hypothetical protein
MELNRRQFVNLATGSAATCLLSEIAPTVGNSDPPIKAIAFDGFTTFDPRSVFALGGTALSGQRFGGDRSMRPPRPLIRESNLAMLVDRPGSVALRALRGQEA